MQAFHHGFVIFQFHHKSWLFTEGQRQKDNIDKAAACGQFTDKPVIFSCTVISKPYRAAQ